jgi:enamine deaminase RidA (YjgF/YER057c/UK114 family)
MSRRFWILFFLACIIALLPWILMAQSNSIPKEKFHANKAVEDGIGYAQAVRVGNTIYISGHVARGPMNEAVGKVYDRLKETLANYQATFQNVVKETVYTTQIDDFIQQGEVRKKYYQGDYPAATWVGVDRLFAPDIVLEVELTVVLPEGR